MIANKTSDYIHSKGKCRTNETIKTLESIRIKENQASRGSRILLTSCLKTILNRGLIPSTECITSNSITGCLICRWEIKSRDNSTCSQGSLRAQTWDLKVHLHHSQGGWMPSLYFRQIKSIRALLDNLILISIKIQMKKVRMCAINSIFQKMIRSYSIGSKR